jgi:hypothetical protein
MALSRAKRFSPLPPNGEWTRHHSWGEVYALCEDRAALRGGLKRLRACAPPPAARLLLERHPRFPVHPVVHDYVFRGNRFSLAEFAVAVERYRPKRLKERLWNREGYHGFVPELVAGLTIQHTGATVLHEPLGARGPDLSAVWSSGARLYAEIVCPRLSKQSRRVELTATHLQWGVMAAFGESARIRSDTGTRITLAFPDDLIQELVERGAVNDQGAPGRILQDVVREATADLEALEWPMPDGTYSMGRAGKIVVQRESDAGPGFTFDGNVLPWGEVIEAERLRGVLSDKAGQLRRVREIPGLIVLDTHGDSLSRNLASHVLDDLESESWAADLAGVLILDRVWNGTTPDCVAVFLPGKRWEAAVELVEGFRECEHGHLHAPSGVFAAPPCPGNPWL